MRPCRPGLPTASSHSSHRRIPALSPGTVPVVRPPSVLSPFASTSALPSSGRCCPPPQRALPLLPRSYGLMRRSHLPLLSFGSTSFEESSQVVASPCCEWDLPDVISANPSRDAWPLTPAVPQGAFACFFPCVIGLPRESTGSASGFPPLKRLRSGQEFRGGRQFFMFRPPSLLAPQIVPTAAHTAAGQPGLLRPSRTCFVTSACIGYASRPNTGN
jgi:hypothetical protein